MKCLYSVHLPASQMRGHRSLCCSEMATVLTCLCLILSSAITFHHHHWASRIDHTVQRACRRCSTSNEIHRDVSSPAGTDSSPLYVRAFSQSSLGDADVVCHVAHRTKATTPFGPTWDRIRLRLLERVNKMLLGWISKMQVLDDSYRWHT